MSVTVADPYMGGLGLGGHPSPIDHNYGPLVHAARLVAIGDQGCSQKFVLGV